MKTVDDNCRLSVTESLVRMKAHYACVKQDLLTIVTNQHTVSLIGEKLCTFLCLLMINVTNQTHSAPYMGESMYILTPCND
jgi:hypothetical protein